jgi:hypothetical protein
MLPRVLRKGIELDHPTRLAFLFEFEHVLFPKRAEPSVLSDKYQVRSNWHDVCRQKHDVYY